MRTILAPANDGNSSSWYCWATVHGIKSPEARFPLDKPFDTDVFDICPSKHTYKNIILFRNQKWNSKMHSGITNLNNA